MWFNVFICRDEEVPITFIIQTSQSKAQHNFLDQGIPGVRVSSGEGQMRRVAVRGAK